MRTALMLWGVVGLFSGPIHAAVNIDCDDVNTPPNAIQSALDSGETKIQFQGTCTESIFYEGVGPVKLRGTPSVPSIIDGGLSIVGAFYRLEDFTIQGAATNNHSVFLTDGANGHINNVTFRDLPLSLYVLRGSTAVVKNSVLNQVGTQQDCGVICVIDGSHARLENVEASADVSDTSVGAVVTALRDSSIVMRGGNQITNAGTSGTVGVYQDSSLRIDDWFNNGTDIFNGGFVITNMSSADIREGAISGPISISRHSLVELGIDVFGGVPESLDIVGDIEIEKDSALEVSSPLVTINGAVICADDESSLNTEDFSGAHTIDCTGYDNRKLKGKNK